MIILWSFVSQSSLKIKSKVQFVNLMNFHKLTQSVIRNKLFKCFDLNTETWFRWDLPSIIHSTMVFPTIEVTKINEKQNVQIIWSTVQGASSSWLKWKLTQNIDNKSTFHLVNFQWGIKPTSCYCAVLEVNLVKVKYPSRSGIFKTLHLSFVITEKLQYFGKYMDPNCIKGIIWIY